MFVLETNSQKSLNQYCTLYSNIGERQIIWQENVKDEITVIDVSQKKTAQQNATRSINLLRQLHNF